MHAMPECLVGHGSLSTNLQFSGKINHTHKLKYNVQNERYIYKIRASNLKYALVSDPGLSYPRSIDIPS